MRIVVITDVSGAGKSEAVRSFEDMGYFCIDNLPPELVRKSAELFSQSDRKVNRIALVIDVRSGESFAEVLTDLEDLRRISPDFRILFLEASDEALLRRFKETRPGIRWALKVAYSRGYIESVRCSQRSRLPRTISLTLQVCRTRTEKQAHRALQ